jgi:hypothetical protein
MGGTMRIVKYEVCAIMAKITLRPAKAPMKPYRHTIQDGEGGSAFPRKPSHLLSHVGSFVRPLWMMRSTGTSGSYGIVKEMEFANTCKGERRGPPSLMLEKMAQRQEF